MQKNSPALLSPDSLAQTQNVWASFFCEKTTTKRLEIYLVSSVQQIDYIKNQGQSLFYGV